MGGIIMETERLSLREITADDLDDLLEICGDPETMRFFPRTLDNGSCVRATGPPLGHLDDPA